MIKKFEQENLKILIYKDMLIEHEIVIEIIF